MQAFVTWLRVVGNFVLSVAAGLEKRHRQLVKLRVLFRVLRQFATLVTSKKFGILLIRQAVSRNVLWSQVNGLSQTSFPGSDGLARNSEHQVEIYIRESGLFAEYGTNVRLVGPNEPDQADSAFQDPRIVLPC